MGGGQYISLLLCGVGTKCSGALGCESQTLLKPHNPDFSAATFDRLILVEVPFERTEKNSTRIENRVAIISFVHPSLLLLFFFFSFVDRSRKGKISVKVMTSIIIEKHLLKRDAKSCICWLSNCFHPRVLSLQRSRFWGRLNSTVEGRDDNRIAWCDLTQAAALNEGVENSG